MNIFQPESRTERGLNAVLKVENDLVSFALQQTGYSYLGTVESVKEVTERLML